MKCLIWIFLFTLSITLQAQELVTYEAPGSLKHSARNDDFSVLIRKNNDNINSVQVRPLLYSIVLEVNGQIGEFNRNIKFK